MLGTIFAALNWLACTSAFLMVAYYGLRYWATAMARRAERVEYLCCPWCFYDLRGSVGVHGAEQGPLERVVCPECGSSVTRSDIDRFWSAVIDDVKADRW
ncbi:MAG: hypothetical protein HRU70_05925 [Phycisphaeraceae bacterium]|nr:MAG: hypothetical protein HRU70_05925 [Phycisphaeraceae bacterium]